MMSVGAGAKTEVSAKGEVGGKGWGDFIVPVPWKPVILIVWNRDPQLFDLAFSMGILLATGN